LIRSFTKADNVPGFGEFRDYIQTELNQSFEVNLIKIKQSEKVAIFAILKIEQQNSRQQKTLLKKN
jgi:hypothetical protein